MPKVKRDAVEKVAFATELAVEPTMLLSQDSQDSQDSGSLSADSAADLEWARKGLDFEIGNGTWAEIGQAIAQAYGGKAEAARAAGISLSTFKSQLARGNAPSNARQFAQQLGLSAEYVELGRPTVPADFDIEAVRLKLARGAFTPTGSTMTRRLAIRHVVEQLAEQIDRRRFLAAGERVPSVARLEQAAGLGDAPDALFSPPMLTTALGLPGVSDTEASPLAFSREWLVRQRFDPEQLGMIELRQSWYLVDLSLPARQLVDGCTYVVHDDKAGRFVLCRWRRDDRTLVLVEDQPWELDRYRQPDAVVGRVVYALSPV